MLIYAMYCLIFHIISFISYYFQDFLAYVAEHSKDLSSVEDILEKYRVLCNMQTELKETLESDLQFMIQSRNDADDLTEVRSVSILRNTVRQIMCVESFLKAFDTRSFIICTICLENFNISYLLIHRYLNKELKHFS